MRQADGAPGAELPFRFVWNRAIQDSDLKPTSSLVAYAFGQFIGADRRNPSDTVWLSLSELQRITRLSRDAANRGTRTLRDAGWLTPVTPAAQHRSVLYRAIIPAAQQSGSRTHQQSASRTAENCSSTGDAISGTAPDTSSTADVPHKERTRKEQEGPPLYCERHHPSGSRGLPCRACGNARTLRRAWEAALQDSSVAQDDVVHRDHRRQVQEAPDCPHGIQGGDLHRPWLPGYSPRCATCRHSQTKSA